MNSATRHGSLLNTLADLASASTVQGAVLRALLGWLCVLVAFLLYRVSVGWWLAPEQAPEAVAQQDQPQAARGTKPSESMLRWFGDQPDAWELRTPKVLRTDQGILLFQKYKVLRGGRVKIWPCSLVLLPREQVADPELRERQAIILQAPEGAILQFDRGFDLRRGQVGELGGGTLLGKITIRSQGRSPGPEDDLWLSTYDVKLSRDSVYTPHPVQFRWGANYGSGRELFVQLVQNRRRGRGTQLLVESLELKNDVSLHLVLQEKKAPQAESTPPTKRTAAGTPPGRNVSQPAKPPAAGTPSLSLVARGPQPLDINCTGPMRIDFLRHEATFQREVEVTRRWKDSAPDRLTADRLRLKFAVVPRAPAAAGKTGKAKPQGKKNAAGGRARRGRNRPANPLRGRWKIELLEATGHPALLQAPRSGLLARGHRLAYHVPTGRVELEDLRQGLLQQGRNRLRARKLVYEPGTGNTPGRFQATGRGDIRWLLQKKNAPRGTKNAGPGPNRNPQVLEAAWAAQMQGIPGPDGTYQVVLVRDAMLRAWGQGQLRAQQIRIGLIQRPVPAKQPGQQRLSYRPRRLEAQGAVRVASPQLNVETEKLTVEFLSPPGIALPGQPARPATAPAAGARTGFRAPPSRRSVSGRARAVQRPSWPVATSARASWPVVAYPVADRRRGSPAGSGHLPPPGVPTGRVVPAGAIAPAGNAPGHWVAAANPPGEAAPRRQPGRGRVAAAPQALRRYELRGQEVQLWVIDSPGNPQPEHLLVTGQAQLREVLPGTGTEKPLVLQGNRIQARNLSTQQGQLRLEGHPAHLEGRSLVLQGPVIQLDQKTNRLWIDSAGKMWVQVDRSWRGTVDGSRQPLVVQWMGSMQFDGRKAVFDRAVVARRGDDHLQTETLEVHLKDPLLFRQTARQNRPQLARIVCSQGVFAQSRQYDGRGLVSWEQMSAADLSINQISGAVVAQGPGWLRRVMRADQVKESAGPVRGGSKPQQNLPLRYLGITFRKGLTGNLHRREMLFTGQVEVVYGPVAHWEATLDADQPERLGPRGIAIHCEKLSLAQLPVAGGRWALEIQASENTVIEGALFTARAHRAAYSQAKERLVLEGTARSPALLQRWAYPGGPASTATARKILYWRRTNQVRVEDAQSLDLAQPPRPDRR